MIMIWMKMTQLVPMMMTVQAKMTGIMMSMNMATIMMAIYI